MSIETISEGEGRDCTEKPCSSIKLFIAPRSHNISGLPVNRVLPFMKCRKVGPWLFFDHMGPVEFKAGEGINVAPHPHINLATVTYLFEGEIVHRDSVGTVSTVYPGDINLMVAGKGIVHSERTSPERMCTGQVLNGLQLWMALPEADEEIDPAFYHYDSNQLPSGKVGDVMVTVMIGEAFGMESPVKTFAQTLYAEVQLEAGQTIDVPKAEELAVYVVEGLVEVEGKPINPYHMAVFDSKRFASIEAKESSRIVFIGGDALPKRHIYWNFVSTRKDRI